ncbi:MAG TPA: hypothetical protein VFV75_08370 [Candidatus Polarisedimenticolaceae bacterium]|nr:hypothetical protein [Candidatus Polarisedimenticolaceae bacterium]
MSLPRSREVWWVLSLLVFLYAYPPNQYPHWKDTNPCSRVYQTLAMVDDGTFAIDGPLTRYGDTEDKAEHAGKHYSDKPPGVAFLLYPVAKLLRAFIPVENFERMFLWLRLLGLSLPSALFWWGTWPWWVEWSGSARKAAAVILIGALGTGWWAYSTALYSHVFAGALLFAGFLLVRHSRRPLLAGTLCSAAFVCDFVVVLAVPVVGLMALKRSGKGALRWLVGLLPPLALWMLYNTACLGGPLQLGFLAHADPRYAAAYRGGFLGMQVPEAGAFLGMTFSAARGLFFFTPALLLAFAGWRKRTQEAWVCACVCLAIFAFALTTVDWRAGWAYGPRYLVPMIPFLLVGVAAAVRDVGPDHPFAVFLAAGGVVGIVWSTIAMLTTPLLVQEFRNPLVHFAAATLLQGKVAPMPLSVLPAVVLAMVAAVFLMGGAKRSLPASALLAVLLLAQVLIPDPRELRRTQEIERAELLIRMGYPDAARARLAGISP